MIRYPLKEKQIRGLFSLKPHSRNLITEKFGAAACDERLAQLTFMLRAAWTPTVGRLLLRLGRKHILPTELETIGIRVEKEVQTWYVNDH